MEKLAAMEVLEPETSQEDGATTAVGKRRRLLDANVRIDDPLLRHTDFTDVDYGMCLHSHMQRCRTFLEGTMPKGALETKVRFVHEGYGRMAARTDAAFERVEEGNKEPWLPEDTFCTLVSLFTGQAKDVEAMMVAQDFPVAYALVAEKCPIRRAMTRKLCITLGVELDEVSDVATVGIKRFVKESRAKRNKHKRLCESMGLKPKENLLLWLAAGPLCQDLVRGRGGGKYMRLMGERSSLISEVLFASWCLHQEVEPKEEKVLVTVEQTVMFAPEHRLLASTLDVEIYEAVPVQLHCGGVRSWMVNYIVPVEGRGWARDLAEVVQKQFSRHGSGLMCRPTQQWRSSGGKGGRSYPSMS